MSEYDPLRNAAQENYEARRAQAKKEIQELLAERLDDEQKAMLDQDLNLVGSSIREVENFQDPEGLRELLSEWLEGFVSGDSKVRIEAARKITDL